MHTSYGNFPVLPDSVFHGIYRDFLTEAFRGTVHLMADGATLYVPRESFKPKYTHWFVIHNRGEYYLYDIKNDLHLGTQNV